MWFGRVAGVAAAAACRRLLLWYSVSAFVQVASKRDSDSATQVEGLVTKCRAPASMWPVSDVGAAVVAAVATCVLRCLALSG